MAKLHSTFEFTGGLGNLSAYKRWDSDKIIIRKKGGPSREKVKTSDRFELTRKVNMEFGGRSTGSKYIMKALRPLKKLADHNIAGPLNKLLNSIQALDKVNRRGKREVCFTKNPALLEGFSLNRRYSTFDSILRNPLSFSLSHETAEARIEIPALIPGYNFFVPPGNFPLYSFIMTVGIVPDLFYTGAGYEPEDEMRHYLSKRWDSPWYPSSKGSPAIVLETGALESASLPANPKYIVLLSVGIRFGVPALGEAVEQVKHAGAAKVLEVR